MKPRDPVLIYPPAYTRCLACQQLFHSAYAFEMHRGGRYDDHSRRCLNSDEMEKRGMRKSTTGIWSTTNRRYGNATHSHN